MKRAAIVGYGKSGKGAAKLLTKEGYSSDIYDDRISECIPLSEFTDTYALTVISPGINVEGLPATSELRRVFHEKRYTSEVELAYELVENQMAGSTGKIITVTGTNGKSTVTYLTAQILSRLGKRAVPCGNFGYPFIEAVLESKDDDTIYVVELSSFQIELLQKYRTDVAVLTNLSADHLDRYTDICQYFKAKLKLLKFINSSGALYTPYYEEVALETLSLFNKLDEGETLFHTQYIDLSLSKMPKLVNNILHFDLFAADVSKFQLFGIHNIVNLVFALLLANKIVPLQGDITEVIAGLVGMPHRTEVVYKDSEVTWINDSKATNIDSTLVALKSCEFPTIVMLGGRDKKGNFLRLVDELNRCADVVIFFGEAADIIHAQLYGHLNCDTKKVKSLKDAVIHANNCVVIGSTVIMTPACTSYDEFNNFEHRGEMFKKYVNEIAR